MLNVTMVKKFKRTNTWCVKLKSLLRLPLGTSKSKTPTPVARKIPHQWSTTTPHSPITAGSDFQRSKPQVLTKRLPFFISITVRFCPPWHTTTAFLRPFLLPPKANAQGTTTTATIGLRFRIREVRSTGPRHLCVGRLGGSSMDSTS
jgi:hypothetical protein